MNKKDKKKLMALSVFLQVKNVYIIMIRYYIFEFILIYFKSSLFNLKYINKH